MPHIIALFNQSGGVGKTTLTQNIAFHLKTDHEQTVLLVDMDPQASLTTFMGLSPVELEETIKDALLNREEPVIYETDIGIDLIPSNILLSHAEPELFSGMRREYRLQEALKKVEDEYDFILIDCPPSLGLLSIMAMTAATHMLIPIQCEFKAVEGTLLLLKMTVAAMIREVNPDLVVLGAAPTMYNRTRKQDQRSIQTIKAAFDAIQKVPNFSSSIVFDPIPDRTAIANASAERVPLAMLEPNNDAVRDIKKIARRLAEIGN